MQMENRERKRERESTDRESKGGRALTSKRAKRERVCENGKDGGAGYAGRELQGKRERGSERGTEGGRTRTKSGTKRPRV